MMTSRHAVAGFAAAIAMATAMGVTGCATPVPGSGGGAAGEVERDAVVSEPQPTNRDAPAECVTLVSRGMSEAIGFVSPETGAVRVGPSVDASLLANATSIGRQGDQIFACAGTVVRIGLADGATHPSKVACDALAADESGIWVAASGSLAHYLDFASLEGGDPSTTIAAPRATVLAFGKGGLIASEPVTASLVRISTSDGTTTPLDLENYGGYILGLAEIGGRIHAVPWYTEGRLMTFDATSGKRLTTIATTGTNEILHGLACRI